VNVDQVQLAHFGATIVEFNVAEGHGRLHCPALFWDVPSEFFGDEDFTVIGYSQGVSSAINWEGIQDGDVACDPVLTEEDSVVIWRPIIFFIAKISPVHYPLIFWFAWIFPEPVFYCEVSVKVDLSVFDAFKVE